MLGRIKEACTKRELLLAYILTIILFIYNIKEMYIKHYLSEPCVDCPSICVKPFISSSPRCQCYKSAPCRVNREPLSLICLDRHDVSKFNWLPLACTLNVCVSFPGMMQGDNKNIKGNLVFALCSQLNRLYCCILVLKVTWHITSLLVLKYFLLLTCISEMTLQFYNNNN